MSHFPRRSRALLSSLTTAVLALSLIGTAAPQVSAAPQATDSAEFGVSTEVTPGVTPAPSDAEETDAGVTPQVANTDSAEPAEGAEGAEGAEATDGTDGTDGTESTDRSTPSGGSHVIDDDDLPLQVATPVIYGDAIAGRGLGFDPGWWTLGTHLQFQWLANGAAIPGATDADLVLTEQQLGARISIRVTGVLAGYRTESVTSALTAPVVRDTLTSAVPTITGTATSGSTLTARPGQWTRGTQLSYQWLANGKNISGATKSTFKITNTQRGTKISVAVTGKQTNFAPQKQTSAATLAVPTTAVPGITGSAVVGKTLTAQRGSWTSGTTFRYQWLANGKNISGATGSSYKLATSTTGTAITVRVTGTKSGFSTVSSTSKATARVAKTATPKISGTLRSGATLTAAPGSWTSGTGFSYQWKANGKNISGATKKTLKLGAKQHGAKITVTVTGKKSGHTTVALTSSATARVAQTSAPKIAGTAVAGSKLTARTGSWTSGTRFSYSWRADGKAISGATKSTFTVPGKLRGKKITVAVTGTKSGYAKVSRTSAATARVQTAPTPKVTGSASVGNRVTASPGSWASGTSFRYQWLANGSAIRGATGKSYAISSGAAGKRLSVRVTGIKSGFASATRTSAQTKAVGYPSRYTPSASSNWNCPSWAPIKGNHSSSGEWIYHVPGGAYYNRTNPEECFSSAAAARSAGYRASKR